MWQRSNVGTLRKAGLGVDPDPPFLGKHATVLSPTRQSSWGAEEVTMDLRSWS